MSGPQIIPKDWTAQIEKHIDAMKKTSDAAASHPPGAEHERLFDLYEATCHDFVQHLQSHYGSAQGFAEFLRADIVLSMAKAGLHSDLIGDEEDWAVNGSDIWQIAEQASVRYRINYQEAAEGLAHHKAYHHAPAPEFNL